MFSIFLLPEMTRNTDLILAVSTPDVLFEQHLSVHSTPYNEFNKFSRSATIYRSHLVKECMLCGTKKKKKLSSKEDRLVYQKKLFLSRENYAIFKHFKSYRSTCSLYEVLKLENKSENSANGKVRIIKEYFQSVFKTHSCQHNF